MMKWAGYLGICLEGLRTTVRIFSHQQIWHPGQDQNHSSLTMNQCANCSCWSVDDEYAFHMVDSGPGKYGCIEHI
jgi:hypothetical protein